MKRHLPFALTTILLGAGFATQAQTTEYRGCGNVQARKSLYQLYPAMEQEAAKKAAVLDAVKKIDFSRLQKTADDKYIIPIVFHVLHNYGNENISDAQLQNQMKLLNEDYNKGNADTSLVIDLYKPLIANVGIEFRLARLDPNGKPTTGIERIGTSKTYMADNQGKFNYWPPDQYMNVWICESIGSGAAGYAYTPDDADGIRFWDGVLIRSDYVGGMGTSIPVRDMALTHEIAHCLNLLHLWGATNDPEVACGDDGVDDTPITKGHKGCAAGLYAYDTVCTPKPNVDTANMQNFMEYTYCPQVMFTNGQKDRMLITLQNSFAGRDVLVSGAANTKAGMDLPVQDVAPVADFNTFTRYVCAGTPIQLRDYSYGDTIASRSWDFGDGLTGNAVQAPVTYTNTGYKNITLAATSNAGTGTVTKSDYLFVANATPKATYINSFEYPQQNAEWPSINIFGNRWKWSLINNAGYKSVSSMMYNSFDDRAYPLNTSGNALNDWDDIYSPVFDLSNYQPGTAHVNFFSSGASTSSLGDANDRLAIQYSTDCGLSWKLVDTLKGLAIQHMGYQPNSFRPGSEYDWKAQDLKLPNDALKSSVILRLRYIPGVASNNLFIDELGISAWATGVPDVVKHSGVAVYPNPSSQDVNLSIQDKSVNTAKVQLTDVSGRIIYSRQLTAQEISTGSAVLPAQVFGAAGIYLLGIQTNTGSHVEKLIRQ
jgi:PKD repeat protein